MKRLLSTAATDRPNLIFRKAKMARKSVEKYAAKKIQVPEIIGEPVFGIHTVLEALRARKREIHIVYAKKSVLNRSEIDARVQEILEKTSEFGISINTLTDDQLDRLTEYQLHNGICIDASRLEFVDYTTKCVSIFLDKVLDPGNIGAISRSAFCFGADGISFAKGRGPKYITPSMSKASCGAIEHLPIQRVTNFHQFREQLKANGGELVATCDATSARKLGVATKRLHEWNPAKNVGIVLGDEGVGINTQILQLCDTVVTIEANRKELFAITSLNVSVVAGILLHHISMYQNR